MGMAKVKRRRRGDERHRHSAGLQNSGGRKSLSLPYDLLMLLDSLYLVRIYWLSAEKSCRGSAAEDCQHPRMWRGVGVDDEAISCRDND